MEYQPRINFASNKIEEPKEKYSDFQILNLYRSQQVMIQESENAFRIYCSQKYQGLPSADKKIIAQSEVIVAMPISASGEYENKYILDILNKFKDQTLPQKKFSIVCLVNSKHYSDQKSIDSLVHKINEYKTLNPDQNIVTLEANWHEDKFRTINMGYIRGFIYDTVILANSEEKKSQETAIVTFDSDVIDFSDRLLQSYYTKLLIKGEENELLAGNINWSGNTGNDIIDLKLIMHQADSTLSNLEDIENNIRHKYPSDGNAAFKLSTYCNHHIAPNYLTCEVSENSLILTGDHIKHSVFEGKTVMEVTAWVKTNPRRFVSQLQHSNDLNMTWSESWDGLGGYRRNDHNTIKGFKYNEDSQKFQNEILGLLKHYTKKYLTWNLDNIAGQLLMHYEENPEKKNADTISQILVILSQVITKQTFDKLGKLLRSSNIEYKYHQEYLDKFQEVAFGILLQKYQSELPEPYDQLFKDANNNNQDVTKVFEDFVGSIDHWTMGDYLFEIITKFEKENFLGEFVDATVTQMFEYIDLSRLKRVLDYSRKKHNLDNPVNRIKPQFRTKLERLKKTGD